MNQIYNKYVFYCMNQIYNKYVFYCMDQIYNKYVFTARIKYIINMFVLLHESNI